MQFGKATSWSWSRLPSNKCVSQGASTVQPFNALTLQRITAPSVQMDRFIDTEVEQFARDHTEPETDLYTRLREETYRTMKSPEMQVDLIEGRFLKMLVRLTGARVVLELGMFTGYSALMMAEGLPEGGRLITCEIDTKAEAIARRYFAESPH